MKTLILGARGMLGTDLGAEFSDVGPYLFDKEELDITDKNGVQKVFHDVRPDLIINAAAYTDVDSCETDAKARDLAVKVNSEAPMHIAKVARALGAIFVHYSTDYIFSGDREEGYREDDEGGKPVNFYGETKLAGEQFVKKIGGKYYLIRTSWLFGLHGKNFIETILRIGEEKGEAHVASDQYGKPTFTIDLAKRTRELVEGKYDFGVYHITNEPATTRYEFSKEIIKQWRKAYHVRNVPRIYPWQSQQFPRAAKRPRYAALVNTKLPPSRSWYEALEEYFERRILSAKK